MTLWEELNASAAGAGGALIDAGRQVPLGSLATESCFGGKLEALRGKAVVVAARDALASGLAFIELDGVARRMVLCPPDLHPSHLRQVVRDSEAEVWVTGVEGPAPPDGVRIDLSLALDAVPSRCQATRRASCETEWVLLTSGTTGAPKLVSHTLASLTSAFRSRPSALMPEQADQPAGAGGRAVWSTFYDIRRYGGLQIYLRALYCGSLVLTGRGESVSTYLARAEAAGVTHISGTPSHWRKALMSGAAKSFTPAYVRLSGEIADQGILDALRAVFPRAVIAHAFASTEAGVGFEIRDGLAGFPRSLVDIPTDGVEIDVRGGTLRIRSPGNASRYLGDDAPPLKDAEGYVDMGDRIELRDGRYYFVGRSGGIINVGGLKVHPEEVEAVINAHPLVRMSLVRARRNPITGAVVSAEVVLTESAHGEQGDTEAALMELVRREILATCRASLAAHKVPALVQFVPSLEMSPSGKLVRPGDA